MIRRKEFKRIEIEVGNAVYKLFEHAKAQQRNPNDFILFLCNAHYVERYEGTNTNPYVLDYRLDNYNDAVRISNLMEYLNHSYSFRDENTSDSKLSISFELMIYTHMWESKPYLKQLKKLADLCDGQDYNWNVTIPDFNKHTYIREELRDVFVNHNLDIGTMMTNGYHSSLRNAFAHSEYSFAMNDPKLHLLNYKGEAWELSEITFDDWTIRFCYTFLLNYKILQKIAEEKSKLTDGEPGYEVVLMDKDGNPVNGKILYHKERDGFTGSVLAPG